MTYIRMLEWADQYVHRDDLYNFTAIKAHPLHPDPKGLNGMGLEDDSNIQFSVLSGKDSHKNQRASHDTAVPRSTSQRTILLI